MRAQFSHPYLFASNMFRFDKRRRLMLNPPSLHPKTLLRLALLLSLAFSSWLLIGLLRSGKSAAQPMSVKAVGNQISGNQVCPTCAPETQQTIYAPLFDLPDATGSEINLNCRSSHPMDVTPTFYTLDGTPIVGEAIHLQPSEIRFVDTKSLIPAEYRQQGHWGGMSLSYTVVIWRHGRN